MTSQEPGVVVVAKTLSVWISAWMVKLVVVATAGLPDAWERLVNSAPELATVVFLVIYFLRHMATEKEKDREDRKQDRESVRMIGESCKKAIEKNTEVYERWLMGQNHHNNPPSA